MEKHLKRASLCLLFVLAFGRTAMAATYYVSSSAGNDQVSCAQAQNVATPKKTLNGIANAQCVQPGDTLYVRGGTYLEGHQTYTGFDPYPVADGNPRAFPSGNDAAHPTQILGFPGDPRPVLQANDCGVLAMYGSNTKWDGIDIDGSKSGQDCVFTILMGQAADVTNLNFTNADVYNCATNCWGIVTAANVLIQNSKCHDVGVNWSTPGEPGPHCWYINKSQRLILDNVETYRDYGANVDNAFALQIYEYGCGANCSLSDVTIKNSSFHDNICGAVVGSGSNINIYNTLFYNNGYTPTGGSCVDQVVGLDVGFNTTNGILVANNTFYNNHNTGSTGYALGNGGFGQVTNGHFANNISFGNGNDTIGLAGDPTCCQFTSEHNLFSVNPLFVNAAAGDFHVQNGSPAIGAGVTLALVTTDKDGNPRTAPYTIGAFNGAGGGGPTPPTITTSSLPDGVVGAAYNFTLAATGSHPPYSWSVSGLPAGLMASPAGVISGIPTGTGTFAVTATVTDTIPLSATATFNLTVTQIQPPPKGLQCTTTIPDSANPINVTTTCVVK